MVRASRKRGFLLIAESESDERRFLEIKGKIRFPSRIIFVDESSINAGDLQRSLLEVVSFFRVQGQYLPRKFTVWRDQCRDGFCSQPPHRFEAVPAVGRPKSAIGCRDGDYWIKKRSRLLDYSCQLLVMGLGEIALKWGRLDGIDRQHRNNQRRATQRISPGADNGSTFLFHAADNLSNRFGRHFKFAIQSFEPLRFWLRLARCTFPFGGSLLRHMVTSVMEIRNQSVLKAAKRR